MQRTSTNVPEDGDCSVDWRRRAGVAPLPGIVGATSGIWATGCAMAMSTLYL